MKRILFLAIVVLMLATLVACGGSSNSSTNTSTASKYTITMSGVTFDTNSITIPKGSTIIFMTSQGGAAHIGVHHVAVEGHDGPRECQNRT